MLELGPQFWAIVNDRTPNPFVDRGKLTKEGLEHLERLKRKKERRMTREDFVYFLKRRR